MTLNPVFGYTRVSTEEQARSGLSLQAQEDKIKAYAQAMDYQVTRIFCDDGYSGATLNRPQLQRMLQALVAAETRTFLVFKLDRLSRNLFEFLKLYRLLEAHGITFSSVNDQCNTATANGRLMMNVIMSVAEWERDTIVERTKTAMNVQRTRGIWQGSTPFGYIHDVETHLLTPDPVTFPWRERILFWSEQGTSYNEIAKRMNASTIRPISGKSWYASSIRAIVTRDSALKESQTQTQAS